MEDQAHNLVERARRLVATAAEGGAVLRVLGGVAVAMRCPSATQPPLARPYHDLDLVTSRADARRVGAVLTESGLQANQRFNALHGRSRLIYTDAEGLHVDVLVGRFEMCHKLELSERLAIDPETLSLGDLALTKLQIAELNLKDAKDLTALLLDHPLTEDDAGIDVRYIAELLARDWGWWRTVTGNLDLLVRHLEPMGLPPERSSVVVARVDELRAALASRKKSLGWRSRAKLGDRVAWRDEPEEIATA